MNLTEKRLQLLEELAKIENQIAKGDVMKIEIQHTYDAECEKCKGVCEFDATTPKHTPTPWQLPKLKHHRPNFSDSFRSAIEILDDKETRVMTDRDQVFLPEEWDDIVCAVNSHEALLKAAKRYIAVRHGEDFCDGEDFIEAENALEKAIAQGENK